MQKRVNLTEKAWDCFSLGRLARLALGCCQYLDFERIPIPRMRLTVPKLYPKMWLILNSCFPSGNLEFFCGRQKVPSWPTEALSLYELPCQATFHTHVLSQVVEELSESCVTPTGRGSGTGEKALVFFGCCLTTKLCPTLLQPQGLYASRLLCPWDFPGKNTGMGHHSLLQGIEHRSPALQANSLPSEPTGKPHPT